MRKDLPCLLDSTSSPPTAHAHFSSPFRNLPTILSTSHSVQGSYHNNETRSIKRGSPFRKRDFSCYLLGHYCSRANMFLFTIWQGWEHFPTWIPLLHVRFHPTLQYIIVTAPFVFHSYSLSFRSLPYSPFSQRSNRCFHHTYRSSIVAYSLTFPLFPAYQPCILMRPARFFMLHSIIHVRIVGGLMIDAIVPTSGSKIKH